MRCKSLRVCFCVGMRVEHLLNMYKPPTAMQNEEDLQVGNMHAFL